MKKQLMRLSAIASLFVSAACQDRQDITKGMRLGQRIYNFDYDQQGGLVIADYASHALSIVRNPFANPMQKEVITSVNVAGAEQRMLFAHSARWLEERLIVATLSKTNPGAPKLQGMVLLIDPTDRKGVRLDDIFADKTLETFPNFGGPCGTHIVASYAGINAVILFERDGTPYQIIGEIEKIALHLRSETLSRVRHTIDVGLKNPHGVVCAGDFLFIADTGNKELIRIQGRDASFLHRIRPDKFEWRTSRPGTPVFASPTSLRIVRDILYVSDHGTGVLFRLDAKAALGTEFGGEEITLPTRNNDPTRNVFDFAMSERGWIVNEGSSGVLRVLAKS